MAKFPKIVLAKEIHRYVSTKTVHVDSVSKDEYNHIEFEYEFLLDDDYLMKDAEIRQILSGNAYCVCEEQVKHFKDVWLLLQ